MFFLLSNLSNMFCYCFHSYLSLISHVDKSKSKSVSDSKKEKEAPVPKDGASATAHIAAQTFTFRELAAATKNFRPECLLGEGGFGRVYKGCLESTKQVSCG